MDLQTTLSVLKRLDVHPSRRRGQNFLVDNGALREIADFADLDRAGPVLEIGPGIGALTAELDLRAGKLKLVEVEEKFCSYLRASYPRAEVICADILKQSAESLLAEPTTVVSNVPYSISSELILWILNGYQTIRSASLLLQKEFAERLASEPGCRAYGTLTVRRAYIAEAELGPVIGKENFFPEPEVDSRLVRLTLHKEPRVQVGDEAFFFKVVRASFSGKRKTLLNSLASSGLLGTKSEVQALLQSINIDPIRRAETLSLAEFAILAAAAKR